jgi:hypothetical protein
LYRDVVFSEEPVMIDFHRVDLAPVAEIVRIGVFVSQDAPGDGSDPSSLLLLV